MDGQMTDRWMDEQMDRQTDKHTDNECDTIIPCHFHVVGIKKYVINFIVDNSNEMSRLEIIQKSILEYYLLQF